jgi:ATP synthase subunit 6
MFSPLEQFHILPVKLYKSHVATYLITNLDLHHIFLFVILAAFFVRTGLRQKIIPTPFQSLVEELYFFILSTVQQQATFRGVTYFPLIAFNFIYILTANIISLLPFSFSLTAEFMTVFCLALTFNVFFFYLGLELNGFKFFYLFYREELQLGLRLFLLPIEVFSYCLRTISLSIRLFANMMAGHTLLHIISGFIIYTLPTVPLPLDIFLILLILAIFTLELMVAFLQAFIFTILLAIYLNDALNPHH